MYDYINEAFKRLDLLNEESFDTSLTGIKKMTDFFDEDDTTDIVRVIDPEAETEAELEDSYIGKVIINCNVCHSLLFKNRDEIILDETGVVNLEDDCPYCGEQEGFVIVGEIKEYEDVKQDEGNTDTSSEQLEESTQEASAIANSTALNENDNLHENSNDKPDLYMEIKSVLEKNGYKCNTREADNYIWSVVDYLEIARETDPDYSVEKWFKDTQTNYPEDLQILECSLNEEFEKATIESTEGITTVDVDPSGEVSINVAPKTAEQDALDDTVADVEGTDETIAPLSDETQTEIEANNGVTSEPSEEDVSTEETPTEEAPAEEPATEEGTTEESSESDIDIEDVDEESLDELGESYLKEVYDNVKSFKTVDVHADDTKMIVEGVITFESGIQKRTGFVFEAKNATNTGKVSFVGLNEHFSKLPNAFELVGNVSNKRLVLESLSYRYPVNKQIVSGRVARV